MFSYSLSVKDREIVICLLDFQEIVEPPRIMQNLVIESSDWAIYPINMIVSVEL